MALSAFADKKHSPGDAELARALGGAHEAWTELLERLSRELPESSCVWGFTSAKTGWGLRVRSKDKVIVYVTPGQGSFLTSFALGEKAVAAARAAKLPGWLMDAIEAAPRYAEGRGVRLQVGHARQVPPLVALARIKLSSSR